MAEVHSIFGTKLNEDGTNPEVVSELEALLEQAKRGDISCFAMAFLDASYTCNTAVTGSAGHTGALGGAIGMLQHRYYAKWHSDE